MTYQTVRLAIADKVATLTLARPARMNAVTMRTLEEAGAAVDEAVAAGARAIILTGEGRAFCSGLDLVGEPGDTMPDDLGVIVDSHFNPLARKLAALDVPVITAVNGPAVGAGVGIALMGDIVVMARSAYLLLAFVNIGLVPDTGATWLVAKGAGRAKALEMALLGERMGADEALAAGLVTRVADDADVLAQAQAIAAKLAAGPSVAVGMIRRQVAAALSASLEETLAIERANQSRAGFTADFKEAIDAFAQKRPPVFQGR